MSSQLGPNSTSNVLIACVSTVNTILYFWAAVQSVCHYVTEAMRSSYQPRLILYQFLPVYSGSGVEVFVEKSLGSDSTQN